MSPALGRMACADDEPCHSGGCRKAYGSCWNRVTDQWGSRRIDEPTPSEIRQLVRAGVVALRQSLIDNLYRYVYIYVMAGNSDIVGQALAALAPLAVHRRSRELSLAAGSAMATLERTGPRRLTDLAVTEGVTQPSMTSVVSQLEDLGFAERLPDPADGRVARITITPAGRRHLAAVRSAGASVFTALIDELTEQEAAALRAALPALRRLLELAAESPDGQARHPDAAAAPGPRPDRMTQDTAEMRSRDCPGRVAGGTAPVIVVGLDGSPASWDAFAWATGEAARGNGRLIAVYATSAVGAFGVPSHYAAADQALQEVARQLGGEAAQWASDAGVPLSFVREPGDVIRALTSVARSAGADLVVVGRSAKMLHHLAGSASRRLVSRHDAPVTVVVP
jgi:DNA-binding MarR family transcriptional regulator/nucleotide-binding universal stress UspA family protein